MPHIPSSPPPPSLLQTTMTDNISVRVPEKSKTLVITEVGSACMFSHCYMTNKPGMNGRTARSS